MTASDSVLEEINDRVNALRDIEEKTKAQSDGTKDSYNTDFYAVFVWRSRAERNVFLKRVGLEDDFRYHNGADLEKLVPEGAIITPSESPQPPQGQGEIRNTRAPRTKAASSTSAPVVNGEPGHAAT